MFAVQRLCLWTVFFGSDHCICRAHSDLAAIRVLLSPVGGEHSACLFDARLLIESLVGFGCNASVCSSYAYVFCCVLVFCLAWLRESILLFGSVLGLLPALVSHIKLMVSLRWWRVGEQGFFTVIGFVKRHQGFSSPCLFYGPLVLRDALLCRLGLDGAEALVDAGVHPCVPITDFGLCCGLEDGHLRLS